MPWFALARLKGLGIGTVASDGIQVVTAHYRRHLFRVKDVHVPGQVEVMAELGGDTETQATAQENWRPPLNYFVELNQQFMR